LWVKAHRTGEVKGQGNSLLINPLKKFIFIPTLTSTFGEGNSRTINLRYRKKSHSGQNGSKGKRVIVLQLERKMVQRASASKKSAQQDKRGPRHSLARRKNSVKSFYCLPGRLPRHGSYGRLGTASLSRRSGDKGRGGERLLGRENEYFLFSLGKNSGGLCQHSAGACKDNLTTIVTRGGGKLREKPIREALTWNKITMKEK